MALESRSAALHSTILPVGAWYWRSELVGPRDPAAIDRLGAVRALKVSSWKLPFGEVKTSGLLGALSSR